MLLIPLCLCKCCLRCLADNNYLSCKTQLKGVLLEAFPGTLSHRLPQPGLRCLFGLFPASYVGLWVTFYKVCVSCLSCLPNCELYEARTWSVHLYYPTPHSIPGIRTYFEGWESLVYSFFSTTRGWRFKLTFWNWDEGRECNRQTLTNK